jgi:eukaryotic-like serine/threonine-protein kinase
VSPCPTDEVLAAYVDQTAADPDSIEEHLDGCQECRVIVAHLGALGALHATAQETLPAEDLATATSPHAAAPLFGPPLPRGTRVDRYVVHHELGRGGMGVVLSAHDPQLDRTVALKIVRPGSRDASARARLLREARAMARLSHPNVVAIHDVGELDDGVFLAMEYVRGTTLRRVLATDRPFGRTMDLFLQAGRGLAAAHAAGIIHRDFKPDNVLVGTDHRVRVTDFGLARGTSSADVGPEAVEAPPADAVPPSNLTGTGAVMGTPAYMAPEQCLGRAATPATDQFAFCVTLFEALAGVRPFAGATFDALAAAKIGGDRRPWPEGSRVPAAVREAVNRGLSALPEDRHESMDVLLAQLERASGTSRARGHWSRIAIPVVVGAIGIGALAIVATRRAGEARAPAAPTAAAACVVGTSALTSIWNDAKKTEVRARLAENASAPVAVDEAIATIDGQARAWAEMHDASCATTRDGTQSEAVFRLRAACLRRRWNELVETIDVLAAGKLDPDDAFRGDPLGSVRACADVRTLGAGDPLPDDPAERAEIEDLYARVARIRAMSGGMWVSLDGLGERAAKLRWAPALAEQALLGAELSAAPKMEDAIVAAGASRDDELVARARRAYARKHASSGPALEDLSIALAAAARLERPDLRADVLEQRAGTEQQLGLFAASLATAREALSLREAGADTPGRSRASWTIDLALVRAESALEVDDLPAARDALAVLLPVQDDAVRAQRLVLGARIAIAEGQPVAALAPLAEARRLAAATRDRIDLMKSRSRELRSRRLAQHALYGALGATAVAEIALGRAADAQRDLVEMLTLLTTNGFRIEPFLEVRAIVALTRLVRGRVPAARVLVQANHAFEIVKMLDPAPIVVEALVGLGEALTAAGDPNAAIARLTHAELLSRDGSLRLRMECASALLSAARARGADPAARPRAEEIARRVLQETKPDAPGHDALAKLVASERSE